MHAAIRELAPRGVVFVQWGMAFMKQDADGVCGARQRRQGGVVQGPRWQRAVGVAAREPSLTARAARKKKRLRLPLLATRSPLARLRPRHDDCGSGPGRLHRRASDPRPSRTDPGRLRSGLEDERTRRDPVATGAARYASDPDRGVTARGFVATDMESVAPGRGREGTDHDRRGTGPSSGPCHREGLRTSRESVASGSKRSLTSPGR